MKDKHITTITYTDGDDFAVLWSSSPAIRELMVEWFRLAPTRSLESEIGIVTWAWSIPKTWIILHPSGENPRVLYKKS